MVARDNVADLVREALAPLGMITLRRMFGAVGVFCDGAMLGVIADGALYFRVDDGNREAFAEAASSPPLSYVKQGRTVEMAYWRAPDRLYDEPVELLSWARIALVAAQRVAVRRATAAQRRGPRPRRGERRNRAGSRAATTSHEATDDCSIQSSPLVHRPRECHL